MDFKQFYKQLIFDIDENINTLYTAKQGDTKSRGFYVTITQNRVVVPVTTQTLTFYAEKSDGTRVYQNAVKDGDKFRIDLTNQVFAVPGTVKCELTLKGSSGEKISSKTFKMKVDKQLAENSIVSKDERGVIDDALNFVTEYVPRMELIDVELLEDYQAAIQDIQDDLVAHKEDYTTQVGQIIASGFNATNKVLNGDFSNGRTGWNTYSGTSISANNTMSVTGTANVGRITQVVGTNNINNKYYARASVRVTNSDCLDILMYNNAVSVPFDIKLLPIINTWYQLSGILKGTVTNTLAIAQRYVDSTIAVGKVMEVKNVLVIDLTETFGVGNEPTKEEMDLLIDSLGGWFDGTITPTQTQLANWYLNMIRENNNNLFIKEGTQWA